MKVRAMSDLLQKINIMRLRLPLKVPYKLAFGNVEAFDTLLAEGCFGERTGVGEATVLTGYTSETIEYAWEKACQIAPALIGQSREALKAELSRHTAKAPFTVCMFMTAIEMAERHHVLSNHEEVRVPLLFGLNHVEALEIEKAFDQAYADGYRTAKVKVGFDADKDLERVGLISYPPRDEPAALSLRASTFSPLGEPCHGGLDRVGQRCGRPPEGSLELAAVHHPRPLVLVKLLSHRAHSRVEQRSKGDAPLRCRTQSSRTLRLLEDDLYEPPHAHRRSAGHVPHLAQRIVPFPQGNQRPGEVLNVGHRVRHVRIPQNLSGLAGHRPGEHTLAHRT